MDVFTSAPLAHTPCAVALGNFDGVHRGHVLVLSQVLDSPNPTVVTFEPHPREYFSGQTGFLLTPEQEKLDLVAGLGFVQAVVLPFNEQLARLPAVQFVQEILVAQLQVKRISIGPDFQFGYKRGGSAALLRELAPSFGFEVCICSEEQWQQGRVSSSAIRAALEQGDLTTARYLLGRNYLLRGTVVAGDGRGRQLGFPTANLNILERKFVPRSGVYRVSARWQKEERLGLLNIGYRPTFDGFTRSVEAHLLDWQGDLYGEILTLELLQYLRPEQKFGSVEELKRQIALDISMALAVPES
ncbi:bifunctional riboflavin kinase/FAD synthetase [Anthocerotibacter panamensis]|uniref:bifunctional riboflavin kinase/FAD synthetase n=1 Tax=Anthocerotibacter panamensis TaxID=2857077 RepID=UPI001C408269|nr:bifunctional riboflavin kinase/FAD synthetase [Anthocerotibacter panamensis]